MGLPSPGVRVATEVLRVAVSPSPLPGPFRAAGLGNRKRRQFHLAIWTRKKIFPSTIGIFSRETTPVALHGYKKR